MMSGSEFQDAYEDPLDIRGEILETPIGELSLREPILVDISSSLGEAIDCMNEHHVGCVLVARNGRLVGIFTERDVLTRVVFREDDPATSIESVMTADPEAVEANATIAFALNKMSIGGFRHIPIVDDDHRPIAVLSVRDIVDFLVDLYPEGVLNLPPSLSKGIADSVDGG